jgi:hypothetical protein
MTGGEANYGIRMEHTQLGKPSSAQRAYESTGAGAAGSGGEEFATIGPATGPGTRLGSLGSLVPRSS